MTARVFLATQERLCYDHTRLSPVRSEFFLLPNTSLLGGQERRVAVLKGSGLFIQFFQQMGDGLFGR